MLVAANLAATVLRFVLLRGWVFRRPRPAGLTDGLGEATGVQPRPEVPGRRPSSRGAQQSLYTK